MESVNRAGNIVRRGTTGLFYCGKHIGRDRLPGSDGFCGPNNGPHCEDCRAFQMEALVNRAGRVLKKGTTGLLYCGRHIGKDRLPGSDGYCGPIKGPQCQDCRVFSIENMNRAGNLMKKGTTGQLYCGKYIGRDRLPGSDGYCGPTNGPQCEDCRVFQAEADKNRAGNCVRRGTTGLFYCGIFIGVARLPHSDGFCGPTNGPQCEDCRAYRPRESSARVSEDKVDPSLSETQNPKPKPQLEPKAHPESDPDSSSSTTMGPCVVCCDLPVKVVFDPCGHLCCCLTCAEDVRSGGCPICRSEIKRVIKVFAS
eukprot:RCo002497